MLLNLHILNKELEKYNTSLYTKEDTLLNLSHCRIILKLSDFDKKEDTLYLIDNSIFSNMEEDISKYHFIITNSTYIKNNIESNIIYLSKNISLSSLSEEIYSIFNKYNNWEKRLTDVILYKQNDYDNMVRKLADIGAEVFSNPFAIFDISLTLVYYAGVFNNDLEGSLWNEVLENGRYLIDKYDTRLQRDTYSSLFKKEEPEIVKNPDSDFTDNIVSIGYFYKDTVIGTIGMTDINEKLNKKDTSLLLYFRNKLEIAYKVYKEKYTDDNLPLHYVEAILKNKEVDLIAIDYHLNKRHLKINDSYILVNLSFKDISNSYSLQDNSLLHLFSDYLPTNISLLFENNLLYIVKYTDSFKENLISKDFRSLLKKYKLISFVSSKFNTFTDLNIAYSQTNILKKEIKKLNTNVIIYEENYRDILKSLLRTNENFYNYSYLPLYSLVREDIFNKELLDILEIYLISGRNSSETAKKLFMHRHTLTSKLGKIEEFLKLDLISLDDNQVYMLLSSCLILNDKKNGVS